MATWVVRLHGRSDVWGPRDMALFGGPFIEGLITGVPDTVRDPRWLEEVLEAAGMDPDCGESYNYDLCLLDGNIMRDEVSDPRILSFAEKEKLRKLAGTEKDLDYSEILRKAQEPVFAVEPVSIRDADDGPGGQATPLPRVPEANGDGLVMPEPADLDAELRDWWALYTQNGAEFTLRVSASGFARWLSLYPWESNGFELALSVGPHSETVAEVYYWWYLDPDTRPGGNARPLKATVFSMGILGLAPELVLIHASYSHTALDEEGAPTDAELLPVYRDCLDTARRLFGPNSDGASRMPAPSESAPMPATPSTPALAEAPAQEATPPASRPWEAIPAGRDREIVRYWWQGLFCKEIVKQVGIGKEKTARNRLTKLRTQYGEEVVPYRRRP